MKNILIVSYSFPPLNNIAARRFGEMYKYLKKFGWNPYILTTNSEGNLHIEVDESNIIRIGNHPQKGMEIKKNQTKSIIRKIKNNLGFNSRLIDRSLDWYKQVKKVIDNNESPINKINFEVIIASYGPGAALFIGKYLSKKLGVPLIADFRDLAALFSDEFYKKNRLLTLIDNKIERYLLKDVKAITTVSKTLAEILYQTYKKDSYVIYNGWDNIQQKNIIVKQNKKNYIYYAGRFYKHRMNSIYMIVNSLKDIKNLSFIIRSLGPKELNEELLEYIKRNNLEEKVLIMPPTSPQVVLEESSNSVANVVIEDLNEKIYWKKGTLTGKFLSLLPLTPPVLAVARADSEIGEILSVTNKGKLCFNEKQIKNFLHELQTKEFIPNTDEINKYSKENQVKKLIEILNGIVI